MTWCSCDGLHSTRCPYRLFRLGVKPATVRARYGDRLITPKKMPSADVELELLPDGFERASTAAIDLEGYRQPAVTVERRQTMSAQEREALADRLQRGRDRRKPR